MGACKPTGSLSFAGIHVARMAIMMTFAKDQLNVHDNCMCFIQLITDILVLYYYYYVRCSLDDWFKNVMKFLHIYLLIFIRTYFIANLSDKKLSRNTLERVDSAKQKNKVTAAALKAVYSQWKL